MPRQDIKVSLVRRPGLECSVCRDAIDAAAKVVHARATATAHLLLCRRCLARLAPAHRILTSTTNNGGH